MGRDTAYWYRRGRGCLWAMAGYIRGPSNRGLFCWAAVPAVTDEWEVRSAVMADSSDTADLGCSSNRCRKRSLGIA